MTLLQPEVILDDLGKHRRRLLHLAQDSNLERGGPNLRIVQLALLLLMSRGGIVTGFVEVGIGHQDERLNGHENLQERTRLWDPSGALPRPKQGKAHLPIGVQIRVESATFVRAGHNERFGGRIGIIQGEEDVEFKASRLVGCAFRRHNERFQNIRPVFIDSDEYSRRPFHRKVRGKASNLRCDAKHALLLHARCRAAVGLIEIPRKLMTGLATVDGVHQGHMLQSVLLHLLEIGGNVLGLRRRWLVVFFIIGIGIIGLQKLSRQLKPRVDNRTGLATILDRFVDLGSGSSNTVANVNRILAQSGAGGS